MLKAVKNCINVSKALIIPGFLTLSAANAGGAVFTMLDGAAKATLIVKAGEGRALQKYIHESTGITLELLRESAAAGREIPLPVYIGDTAEARKVLGDELAALDQEGYIIDVTPERIIIAGNRVNWAETSFLRDYLGIDQYFMHSLGTVVPRHEKILIPAGRKTYEPKIKSRFMSGFFGSGGEGTDNNFWRLRRRYEFHHALHRIIPPQKYAQSHPQYFPLVKGRRMQPTGPTLWQPCLSNPEVRQLTLDYVMDFFTRNPAAESISLGINDSGAWCECDECKALEGPALELAGFSGKHSFIYWNYVNTVAKELKARFPGKNLGAICYEAVIAPPKGLKLEDNVIPYMTSHRADYWDADFKKRDQELMDAWSEVASQIGIYEYFYGRGFSVPRIYNHHFAEGMRYALAKGMTGFYAESYAQWGMDGPKLWIAEKLLWDPAEDVDELLGVWCAALFGQAAPAMKSYFSHLEETWVKNNHLTGRGHWGYRLWNRPAQMEIFQPEDITKALELLDQASKAAATDIVRERIGYFASTFRITELRCRLYHAYKKPLELLRNKAPADEIYAAYLQAWKVAPREDPREYADQIAAAKDGRFQDGPPVAAAAEIIRHLINEIAWKAASETLRQGEIEPQKVAAAAKNALRVAVPAPLRQEPWVNDAIAEIEPLLERIATARRTAVPPAIDGEFPDSEGWVWNRQTPWYGWKSGRARHDRTEFAFLYDDSNLYIGLRCFQSGLDKARRETEYNSPTWRYASVEIFIQPDAAAADAAAVPFYQVIPGFGGGLWENMNQVAEYAITDNGINIWQAELKIPLDKIKMRPADFKFLRLNLVRNMQYPPDDRNSGWFLTTDAHRSPLSRGYLIFGK